MKAFILFPIVVVAGVLRAGAEEIESIRIHGQGWTQMGRIMHVTDTLGVNLNGNWQQSNGAQFTAVASIGDHLEGAFGFGGFQIYHSQGNAEQQRTMRFIFQNFITEARMTYFRGERSAPGFSLTFGNFAYNYNPDVKNLGLYLLRGPVYPGFLLSGFKDFRADTTKGSVMGLHVHHAMGNFQHDLIIANERDLPPTFDWSLAYVAKYQAFEVLEIGGGVNFYRLLPNKNGLTNPSSRFYSQDAAINALPYDATGRRYEDKPFPIYDSLGAYIRTDTVRVYHSVNELSYIEVSPAWDTTRYSLQGTKLMAMFDLDCKKALGISGLGPNDLRLYGEAAVLGVKNYGTVYHDIRQRIPVTFGFNIPTFGLLDYLSLEVEWYGAKYRNSLGKIGNFNSLTSQPGFFPTPVTTGNPIPSPIPLSYQDYYGIPLDTLGRLITGSDTLQIKGTALDVENLSADNWKWSLYLEKTLHNHISFTAQVANDHFRPRPAAVALIEQGGMAEAFSSPKDWYFMFRVGYFF